MRFRDYCQCVWKLEKRMSHQPNNIFAGTQVVSLVEVRGPNGSLVHPRGAVGVVTRTPAVAGEDFLVRFPDGFEKALESSQIEVLKHFKDRLSDGLPQPGKPDSGFDLESCIIYRCVVGSRAYGLDNDESDIDRRGIYLAPAELEWSLFGAPEQFEDNAAQSCYWELQKFILMALKANPNILECLYSPMIEKVTPLVKNYWPSASIFCRKWFSRPSTATPCRSSRRSSRTFVIMARFAGNMPCICCACC